MTRAKNPRLCPRCGHLMDLTFCPDCGVDTVRTISARASRQRYKQRATQELQKFLAKVQGMRRPPKERHKPLEPVSLSERQQQIVLNHYDHQESLRRGWRVFWVLLRSNANLALNEHDFATWLADNHGIPGGNISQAVESFLLSRGYRLRKAEEE